MNFKGLRFDFYQFMGNAIMHIPIKIKCHYDVTIVRTDAIGDYVIWHDSLVAYKKRFAGKKVLLICAEIVKPLAEDDPFFSTVIGINNKRMLTNLSYLLSIQRELKMIGSEIVLNPVRQRHRIGDFLVKCLHSDNKIGIDGTGDIIMRYYNKSYTRLVTAPLCESELEAVEYFTREVISDSYSYGYAKWDIKPVDSSSFKKLQYAVIAISSSDKYRSWEIDKFTKVVDSIPEKYTIIISGAGASDLERSTQLISNSRTASRIINKVNKTSLPQLVSLISGASFLIGNDSAAVHIAAAVHTPSIAICPGAHFGRFIPYPERMPYKEFHPIVVNARLDCYGCNYFCTKEIKGNYECLRLITVEEVVNKLDELLKTI